MMNHDNAAGGYMRQWWASRALAVGLFIVFASGCASTGARAGQEQEQPNPLFVMDTWFMGVESPAYATVEAQLELTRELGYDGFGCGLPAPAELRGLVRSVDEKGLKLYAVYTGAMLTPETLTFDPHLHDAMEVLQGRDTIIWLVIRSKDFARSSPEGDIPAVAGLRELADAAAARGLRLALYPHVGDWVERLQDAMRLVRKTDRTNVGVSFNLCHCLQVGDEEAIPQLLDDAAPHLFVVTINGADSGAAGAGWDRLIQPLGRGSYDLRPLLQQLEGLDFEGPVGLQGYGVKGDVRENLASSMEAWRELSGALRSAAGTSVAGG